NLESLSEPAEDGKDIKLTIDKIIQSSLDKALNNIMVNKNVRAKEAWGALVDIETGRVLALADAPAFNANDPETLYINRGTEYQYEPGSTMKTLTYSMALNEEAINPEDTFDGSSYYFQIDGNGVGKRVPSSSNYTDVIHNPFQSNYGTI